MVLLLAVVLVLFLAVRPLIKRVFTPATPDSEEEAPALADESEEGAEANADAQNVNGAETSDQVDDVNLPHKVELARQLASTQPDRAVEALQRMLEMPEGRAKEAPAQ